MAGNMAEQPVMTRLKHRVVGLLSNSKMIVGSSFFFGNHHGIQTHEREFIAESLTTFLDSATRK